MTMRMNVERNASAERDAHNQPVESFGELAEVPCYAWPKTIQRVSDDGKLASVEIVQAQIPHGTDVTRDDRVATITDRLGVVKFQGPFLVETHPAYRSNHLEVTLRRAS